MHRSMHCTGRYSVSRVDGRYVRKQNDDVEEDLPYSLPPITLAVARCTGVDRIKTSALSHPWKHSRTTLTLPHERQG